MLILPITFKLDIRYVCFEFTYNANVNEDEYGPIDHYFSVTIDLRAIVELLVAVFVMLLYKKQRKNAIDRGNVSLRCFSVPDDVTGPVV